MAAIKGWGTLKSLITTTFTTPGDGVYTVHTAQEKKLAIGRALYGTDAGDYRQSWLDTLEKYPHHSGVSLYAIPSDSGGGIQRGANWGPLAIREILYQRDWAKECFDLGDVRTNPHLLQDELLNQKTLKACRKAMYCKSETTLPVSPLSIAEKVLALHHKVFPQKKLFLLGGDHSVSYPAIKEYLKSKKKRGIRAAVIHFDAHTDLLNERLGIPVCFGSWTSHALKFLSSRDLWIQLGIRSSGKTKEHWEKERGIRQYWVDEFEELGYDVIFEEIKTHLKKKKVQELYITFDIDALDADEVSATGTPERNGLRTMDCAAFIESLSEEFKVTGCDLVEVAPFVHHQNFTQEEPKTTLINAVKIAHALTRALTKH